MPIYEYQCSNCEHRLEALQKISDAPLSECPACRQATLKKLVSAAGFRLKGGGWYETDFKQSGRKQLAESDSRASDGATTSDGKTATPETKATGKSESNTGKAKVEKSNSGSAASSKPASKATD